MRAATAALGVALALVATPAQAAITPGSVTVTTGANPVSDLQLLGVSGSAVAATRNGSGVLAAPTGQATLADYGATYRAPSDGSQVSDLTGNILRWAEPRGSAWMIHREGALDGGGKQDYPSADQPLAFTPDSWIGYAGGTLKKHVFGGTTTTLLTGLTGSTPAVQADDRGALVRYTVGDHTRAGLITFGRAGIEVLADHDDTQFTGEQATTVALTPNSVVWFGQAFLFNSFGSVHRRARAGGAVSAVEVPVTDRGGDGLAATDDTIVVARRGRIVFGNGSLSTRLYALRGTSTTWQPLTVAGQSDLTGYPFNGQVSLRSAGSTIAIGLSGKDLTETGVYRVDGDANPALVARVPVPAGLVTDVSLQAGRLTWAASPGSTIHRATVTTSALAVGPPAVFAPGVDVTHSRENVLTPGLSVSGDRTAVRGDRVRLLTDAGAVVGQTAVLPKPDRPVKRSGDYLLVDDKVYRGETLALDLTSRKCRGEDIFGSLVVCNQPDGKNYVVDAAGRFPTGTTSVGGTGEVAIWGTTVAWTSDASTVLLQDLAVAGSLKSVSAGGIHDLDLSEGSLTWLNQDNRLYVADRSGASLQPIPTDLFTPASVDDHLFAGVTSTGDLKVETGTGVKLRPRLIDADTPVSVSASTSAWKPVFDVTKPLTNVKITIRQGTTTVATLTGAGPTGTVRDLSWKPAAAGTYTWTFTADARDGDGSVTNTDGTSAVTGTVYVTR